MGGMSPELNNFPRLNRLRDRSCMLQKSREFFTNRGLIEVDCPLLSDSAAVDAHIDLITATYAQKETRYLHSSPEYGMKRLLSEGMGDIFQLAHVFRDGESGNNHNPEFSLVEWYRIGWTFEQMIAETCEYIQLFLAPLPIVSITYREAFQKYANLDSSNATTESLVHYLHTHQIPVYIGIEHADKDDLLNLILAHTIEPHLGQGNLTALTHYPVTQAALAKTVQMQGEWVAERFEIYHKGKELANGYHELTNPSEQKKRFEEANVKRQELGKKALPIDFRFLEALNQGIPDCCGVAVGFDRLMMLRHHSQHIADILPFVWDIA